MIKDKTIKFYLLCCQNLFVCHAVKTDVTYLAGFNDAEVVGCELTDRVWVYNQKLDGLALLITDAPVTRDTKHLLSDTCHLTTDI